MTRVLLIAGLGSSGSTLLGAILGQLDGFFFVGELRSVAGALEHEQLCGCGTLVRRCPVWSAIADGVDPRELVLDRRDESARGIVRQRLRRSSPSNGFATLFARIARVTGSRVIVDSSKWPGYAHLLGRTDGVDLAIAHLVRDPRGIVHSRARRVLRTGHASELSPAVSAAQWNLWNPAIEAISRHGRYARVRYEDFVAAPAAAVERLARLVGEDPGRMPFTTPDTVELEPTHSIAGNPNRFQTGPVRIALDDEWRTEAENRRLVGALTWPVRRRYGY